MSDFRALFRKAQASRGVASSKQQIRKLKSQRATRHETKVGISDEKNPVHRSETLHAEFQVDSNINEPPAPSGNASNTKLDDGEESTGNISDWVPCCIMKHASI